MTCRHDPHGVHGGAKYVILHEPLNRMILLDNVNASLNPQKHCYFTECMKYFIGIFTTYTALTFILPTYLLNVVYQLGSVRTPCKKCEKTQGTSRYYATFLLQISFPSLFIELDIKYISFISNLHIRILQI